MDTSIDPALLASMIESLALTWPSDSAENPTPSHRYMSLLREGARAHGLPDDWLRFLDSVEHHAE
jgi:hypothetical protein